ncbi:MAG: phosphoenolpyruvate--protein phosphotransferase [Ignavibacteriae bacterium]|nr:phosphoenolpyruvate--protein phosphotransferase [Ignavibacteriota bacterium]
MTREKIYRGIPASHGISISKAYLYTRRQVSISHHEISESETENEIGQFTNAVEISRKELNKIYTLSVERIGEENSRIFQAQLDILNDNIFINTVFDRIKKEKRTSGFIFHDEISKLANVLLSAKDDYMKERYSDIIDVKNRVIRNMKREKLVSKVDENSIIFAHELTPADTILFSKRKVQGYATDTGGTTSHTAIISRALRIPAVVGMKVISKHVLTGDTVIIDGYEGTVILNPREETIEIYKAKLIKHKQEQTKFEKYVDLPCQTLDKRKIEITSNIDFVEEVDFIQNCGHCGIGLYRTEHLFMAKGEFPTEAEQIEEYTHIANVTFPKTVTIRTFDLGGDKVLPTAIKESNPNLGWRGIRICLDREDIFKTQLRAILLSSSKKNIKIMYPMISSLDEVRKAKRILNEVKTELKNRRADFDKDIKVGIMVEVPSAFMLADEFAKEVDFFSVGTNDLTQYLLAVDRGNELISGMYQQLHPAVLRALNWTIEKAHCNKIKVSICGELGSMLLAIPVLVGMGIDEISVNPSVFPEIKQIVRGINYSDAKLLVEKILTLSTEDEISREVEDFYEKNVNSEN